MERGAWGSGRGVEDVFVVVVVVVGGGGRWGLDAQRRLGMGAWGRCGGRDGWAMGGCRWQRLGWSDRHAVWQRTVSLAQGRCRTYARGGMLLRGMCVFRRVHAGASARTRARTRALCAVTMIRVLPLESGPRTTHGGILGCSQLGDAEEVVLGGVVVFLRWRARVRARRSVEKGLHHRRLGHHAVPDVSGTGLS